MTDSTNDPPVDVVDDTAASRYEARITANPAGGMAVATYEMRDSAIAFLHTVVPHSLQGHGIGGVLARAVLDDARRRGLAVIPICPFIAAYIQHHPAYRDLVPEALRDELLTAPLHEATDG